MDQLLRERVQDGQVKGLIWELATAGQGLPEAGPELRYQVEMWRGAGSVNVMRISGKKNRICSPSQAVTVDLDVNCFLEGWW